MKSIAPQSRKRRALQFAVLREQVQIATSLPSSYPLITSTSIMTSMQRTPITHPQQQQQQQLGNENKCPNNTPLTNDKSKTGMVAKMAILFDQSNARNKRVREVDFGGKKRFKCAALVAKDTISPKETTEPKMVIDKASSSSETSSPVEEAPILPLTPNETPLSQLHTTNANNDVLRERRRKIMLQERRMEKVLSQKSAEKSAIEDGASTVALGGTLEEGASVVAAKVEVSKTESVALGAMHQQSKVQRQATVNITLQPSHDDSTPSQSFTMTSRVLLFALALFEVQQHCTTTSNLLAAILQCVSSCFGSVLSWFDTALMQSDNGLFFRVVLEFRQASVAWFREVVFPWRNALHVAFVLAFMIRGFTNALASVRALQRPTPSFDDKKRHQLKCVVLFVTIASCWMMVLPLFHTCNHYKKGKSTQFCFFVEASKNVISAPRYSTIDIIVIKLYKMMHLVVKRTIKGHVMKQLYRAFINPFRFHGRLKKLFTIIRWAKFLAPLIGTCNKLRGHILDMSQKKRQHSTSKTARRMWKEVLDALSTQTKSERAALLIQKSFRERRENKAKRRYELLVTNRNNGEVTHQIRKKLKEERTLSKSKLAKFEVLDNQRELRRQVSQDERANITKYNEAKRKEKKRLLLSPKTAFAVVWKCVAISCVVLEISQILFAPVLSGELGKMPLDKFISAILFASPCESKKPRTNATPSIMFPAIDDLDRYLCTNSSLKQNWLVAVHILASILVLFTNTVFFLDVLVTFLTGELTSSGKLVPKPFFARYILPGIGLQLIVNPTMVELSGLFKRAVNYANAVGPSLCSQLLVTCFPMVSHCYDCLLDIVFDFVERQNKILLRRPIFD